jgi:hypothetical protein
MVYGYCHSKNMKVMLHSCGNVKEFIPMLIEAGLDCLQPLEVKAGMDVRELKGKYGDKLTFMGGIDVRLMNLPDKSKIEEEIRSKFEVAKKGGGYIYHSDHSIPHTVSFQDFCTVMELVKKYGAYEHPAGEEIPEEIPIQTAVAPAPAETPEPPEKKAKKGLFGFMKKEKKASPEPKPEKPQPAAAPQQAKPQPAAAPQAKAEKKGMFGFLKKEK